MKCQKCGGDASFFYSSNINGEITEMRLCDGCAEAEGYSFDELFTRPQMTDMNRILEGLAGMTQPQSLMPQIYMPRYLSGGFPLVSGVPRGHGGRGTAAPATETRADITVDETLSARREINVLREKMRAAADAEDFETAARLRDEINAIEGGR